MNTFEKLTQAVADHEMCWAAFKAAEQQGKDVTAAVASRIEADKRAHIERLEMLERQSCDQVRPEVVRRLARQEFERMQGRTFELSEDETAAFNSAIQDAEAALRDFVATESKLRDLFEQANGELKATRAATLGNGSRDPDLAKRWLEGVQQGFDRLVRCGGSSE